MYCEKCGVQLTEEVNICSKCGTQVILKSPAVVTTINTTNRDFEEFGFKKKEIDQPLQANRSDASILKLDGVKGWLKLYCIMTFIYGPGRLFQGLTNNWENTLSTATFIFAILYSLYIIITIINLWRKSKYSLFQARFMLWSQLAFLVLIYGLLILSGTALSSTDYRDLIGGLLSSAIWLGYFYSSTRVQVTYRHLEKKPLFTAIFLPITGVIIYILLLFSPTF